MTAYSPVAVELVIDVTTDVYDSSSHVGRVLALQEPAEMVHVSRVRYAESATFTHSTKGTVVTQIFMPRYSNWRSKHESSACTEDIGHGIQVGRNGGRQDCDRGDRATREVVEGVQACLPARVPFYTARRIPT